MIGKAIRTLLLDSAAIAAEVGARVYPLILPQHPVMPAMTYRYQADRPDITFDGQGQLQEVQVELDCWGDDYDEAVDLADIVESTVKNYSGTPAGVEIQQIYIESTVPVYEKESEKYRITHVVTVYRR